MNKEFKIFKNITTVLIALLILGLAAGTASAGPWANPAIVNLGNASNFVILSSTAISNVPTSVITGDIGISPAGGDAITGFACTGSVPTSVNGTIHVASAGGPTLNCQTVDPLYLTPTILEYEAAYTDATNRALDADILTALDGITYTRGVYTAANLDISNDNNVTLNCEGDASGVFIFRTAGHLNVGTNADVILTGGCQPGNIFWAVAGTTAILGGSGTESHFSGTVLGGQGTTEISLGLGSTVNGRLMSDKTISLNQNTITNQSAGVATYIPPSPVSLARTQANFWINYTWTNGTGNVTDSYNVTVNGTWTNGSSLTYKNSTVGPHNWSNISVYAYNSSGTGTLNTTNVTNNTQVANNVPDQTGIGTKTITAGNWLNFTVNTTDADNDTITYGTNATKGLLNTTTGNFTWLTTSNDVSTYSWEFNSSDAYGGVDNETITVTVNAGPTPPPGDTTAPMLTSTFPRNHAIDVAINSAINAVFNEEMNPQTINTDTFTLKQGETPVNGTVILAGATATFTPAANLSFNTTYTATITTGATDMAGNALAEYNNVWTFTTGVNPDTTPPMVTATVHANGSTGVPINTKIAATFSEAMYPLTINSTTFTFKNGSTAVPGNVTYSGVTAVFTPDTNLSYNTTYTATITTGAKDLAGNALASDYVWSWTTGAAPDTTPPMVTATINANGSTGVPINTKIAATFSEAMDPLTITTTTFTFKNGSTAVPGTVDYSGVTAVFTPTNNLSFNTTYTATITTGAKDLAGNAMASDYVWSWTTSHAPDTTPPTVSSTIPANLAIGVAINSAMSATFSEAMDPLTVTTVTFTLKNGSTPVSGVVTYSGVTATFTPAANLTASTNYTARITTGAKDLAENALASNYVWNFTTGATADTTPPTVSSTVPVNLAANVATNSAMAAVFNEALDPLTVTTITFTLKQGETPVSGTVTYSGVTAVFTPSSSLSANTSYTATITTGAKDLAGNALAVNKVWTFTTGTTAQQVSVDLGSADNFVILAKTGISTTGTTSIVGDIGVSPIDSTAITGFALTMDASNEFATSSFVTGKVYASDYSPPTPTMMTTAVLDMETAYTDAAGRTLPDHTELGDGDIGGMTLAPGLYKWSTGVTIPTDVTLSGGTNDVWIFQIAQTLDISSGKQVILSGGAQAKNIFWQVAGQTTLGTTSVFNGNILDQKAIVLNTGARLNGRAFSQTAVTLDANAVTAPTVVGGDTVGIYRSGGTFYLRNNNSAGNADLAFVYGITSDTPLKGDWDGSGTDTVGIYRIGGDFYLRNSNSAGNADMSFKYGITSDTPLVGDWNGDGTDTVGIYRNGSFYLRNSNDGGNANLSFIYGVDGDTPLVGDWDGDGTDTVGIYRDGAFYLRNSNDGGNADLSFGYGIATDTPLVGDWNGDGTDTVGIYRDGAFYLRNSNDGGNADMSFVYGISSDTPLVGNWDGQ